MRTGAARHAVAATGSRAIASARPPRVWASSVPRCSCARSRARPARRRRRRGGRRAPRRGSRARPRRSARRPRRRARRRARPAGARRSGRPKLDAGREHARAALDGQARGVALVAQDERPQRRERRLGEVGASSSRRTPTISRISSSVARLASRSARGSPWRPRRRRRARGRRRPAGSARPGGGQQRIELAREAGAIGGHLEAGALVARGAQLLGALLELADHARCGRRRRVPARRRRESAARAARPRRTRSRRRRPCRG